MPYSDYDKAKKLGIGYYLCMVFVIVMSMLALIVIGDTAIELVKMYF